MVAWAFRSGVDRLLRMLKVEGSIPSMSIFTIFTTSANNLVMLSESVFNCFSLCGYMILLFSLWT